jgi:hypothetical protein
VSVEDGPQGIDVSKWQSSTPPLTGLDFLIARASIGTTPDPMYATHIKNARAKGLLVGAYHFNWSTIPVSDQIEAFLNKAGDVDFYFIDVEYAGNGVAKFTRTQTRDFIKGVRLAKGHCGLYMSESSFYTDVDNDYRWVANWSQPPNIGWKFWQYQGSPLDRNLFNGTPAQLNALTGSNSGGDNVAQRTITTDTPKLIDIPVGRYFYDLDGETRLFENKIARTDMPSPCGRGSWTNADGVTYRFREVYLDADGSGTNESLRSFLVKVKTSEIADVPAPEPVPVPKDCSEEIAAAVAAAVVQAENALLARIETFIDSL